MATTGVIPTLFINQPIIKKDNELMAYLVKFSFYNPGWTSNWLEEQLVSMRKLRAQHTEDIREFPNALQEVLNNAVQRYNPQWKATVTSKPVDMLTYTLIISITDQNGTPVISSDSIVVKDGEIMLARELEENVRDE